MTINKKYRFILIIFLSLTSLQSWATKYFLSPYGDDTKNGMTLSNAFATLAKAISTATTAGDTIFVRSGTFTTSATVTISKSGSAAKHIVLTAYLPDLVNANSRPVFDFSSMPLLSGNVGIQMTGVSYWDIYGIVIKGAGDNGMLIQSSSSVFASYIKIEFCAFTRNRDAGFQIRKGAHHCLILNCDSYENADMGTGSTTAGGNADGFAPKLDVGDSIIFRGCRAWMNSDDGWDGYLKTAGSNYSDGMTTILEDCWAFRNGYYWLDGTTTSSMNGNGIKMGGSANKDEAHNFTVTRCLSFMNKGKGFDQNNNAGSIYLYNNTAHSNLDVDYGLASTGVTYASYAVLVLYNNLSLGSKGVSIRTAGTPTSSTPVTNVTNSFVKSTTSTNYLSLDTTGVTGMRGLNGSLPSINYMHLSVGSAYIDAGTPLPSITYHGALGLTYNGSAPDKGAFETASLPVYTFNGNGNWSVASNWLNGIVPPATMVSGSKIYIDPIVTGQCYLDISYTVSAGCTLTVMTGKSFVIPGFLTKNN